MPSQRYSVSSPFFNWDGPNFPVETVAHILDYLGPLDIRTVMVLSSAFRNLVLHRQRIYKDVCRDKSQIVIGLSAKADDHAVLALQYFYPPSNRKIVFEDVCRIGDRLGDLLDLLAEEPIRGTWSHLEFGFRSSDTVPEKVIQFISQTQRQCRSLTLRCADGPCLAFPWEALSLHCRLHTLRLRNIAVPSHSLPVTEVFIEYPNATPTPIPTSYILQQMTDTTFPNLNLALVFTPTSLHTSGPPPTWLSEDHFRFHTWLTLSPQLAKTLHVDSNICIAEDNVEGITEMYNRFVTEKAKSQHTLSLRAVRPFSSLIRCVFEERTETGLIDGTATPETPGSGLTTLTFDCSVSLWSSMGTRFIEATTITDVSLCLDNLPAFWDWMPVALQTTLKHLRFHTSAGSFWSWHNVLERDWDAPTPYALPALQTIHLCEHHLGPQTEKRHLFKFLSSIVQLRTKQGYYRQIQLHTSQYMHLSDSDHDFDAAFDVVAHPYFFYKLDHDYRHHVDEDGFWLRRLEGLESDLESDSDGDTTASQDSDDSTASEEEL